MWTKYYKFSVERNPWSFVKSLYDYRRSRGLSINNLSDFVEKGGADHISNFHLYSIDGRVAVDEVALYEDLTASLSRLSHRLGLPRDLGEDVSAIQAKTSAKNHSDYRPIFTPRARERVAQRFAHVCDLFGYTF